MIPPDAAATETLEGLHEFFDVERGVAQRDTQQERAFPDPGQSLADFRLEEDQQCQDDL